jgi:hypothetical protein
VEIERPLVIKALEESKTTTDEHLVVMNERNEEKANEIDGLQLRSGYRAAFSKQGTLKGDRGHGKEHHSTR